MSRTEVSSSQTGTSTDTTGGILSDSISHTSELEVTKDSLPFMARRMGSNYLYTARKFAQDIGESRLFWDALFRIHPSDVSRANILVIVIQSLLGLLAGWGIGSAGMRAALAVRSHLLIESTLEKAGNYSQTSVNLDQVSLIEVFRGDFLDVRSSVMFGIFMGFGAMYLPLFAHTARRWYSSPSLVSFPLTSSAPSLPFWELQNPKRRSHHLVWILCHCAPLLLCLLPRDGQPSIPGLISTILGKVKEMLSSQDELLSPKPGDFGPGCPKLKALTEARTILLTMYQNLTGFEIYLKSEFSVGHWSGDDVFGLADPLLAVVARISGLSSFVKHLRDLPSPPEAFAYMPAPATVSSDTNLLHHVFNPDMTRESILKVTLIEALPHVREATAELRAATIEGNRLFSRSGSIAPLEERLDTATNNLRAALDNFKEQGTDAVLRAYGHKPRADIPLRSLYIGYVFSSTAVIIGEVVLSLVRTVAETSARSQRVRLWAPSSLRYVVNALLKGRRKNEEDIFGEEERNETYVDEEDIREKKYQVHDSATSFLQWARTVEAIVRLNFPSLSCKDAKYDDWKFVFRYAVLTILIWLPSVMKSTSHFFYVNKGIWALIMAQTTLTVYAGDQLYHYMIRLAGTFLGLVTALLIWYTGNGSGNGSPYGLAASYAVFLLPVTFIRLFAPPKYLQGVMLGCFTTSIITGYSWADGHLPVLSDPGIGWPASWRRWTLAMIGCGASFIMMMLPPMSGRQAVRLRAATSINALSHVYTSLISAWITEGNEGKDVPEAAMMLASWEGGIRGRWPQEEYSKLTEVQEEMIGVLAQLGGALWKLDTKWRLSLLGHTKVVDPNFIADIVSVFSSVSQSLRTGEPMHTVLPQTLLDRLLLHHQAGWAVAPDCDKHNVIRPEEMQSLNHMFYTSAVIAVYQLMECLDELQAITRRLCGEVPLRGFEQWKFLHKSCRGTGLNILSPTDTVVEREPFIVNEKSDGDGA
ncbi:hypothetical protein B0F90DRAFT_1819180 [Multifurca ochricompacta]|uniref:DUF2421 domain-containing protein n=1 Tax=Multifurca ochricompacta TaxID=376703 RepID=A0AAD4M0F3_9AGAM|nr:hypothetical protein B0F90DRAFT_1819180 [Multifurca ochricompacta]